MSPDKTPSIASPYYRGSSKHKNRPKEERKGTYCPEWTHTASAGSVGTNPDSVAWHETEAHRLFAGAVITSDGKRYATAQGIAFEAKPSGDDSWHGYPIPWVSVPEKLVHQWLAEKKVTRREIRKHFRHDEDDLKWALDSEAP